jgi:hypothetical protein
MRAMKTFLFRFSLSLGVLLMITFAMGQAAAVEAARKPTKTPKPTRTPMPTQTNTPLPTFTLTDTPLPTFTDTPEPTFTFTPTPTPTDTPTSTPCGPLSALILPRGGEKISRTYLITGQDANGCTEPLQYHWDCTALDVGSCINFLLEANAGPYGMPSAYLEMQDFIQYSIQLDLCQIGTSNCDTDFVTYSAVPP